MLDFARYTRLIEERGDDMLMLGFRDRKKVNGIPNATLSLVITATITKHVVSGILINDGSTCNLIYREIFTRLGLGLQDLKPCKDKSLLANNDSTTRQYGGMDMTVSLGEGEYERSTNVHLLVVPYEIIFNDILGSPFKAALVSR